MIKAITFDLWNTLFENISYSEIRFNILKDYLRKINPNIKIAELKRLYEEYFTFISPKLKKANLIHTSTSERTLNLLNELDLALSSSELNYIIQLIENVMLEQPPTLKEGVKETLKILNEDYKLGIISDTGITPGRIIRIILEHYNILRFFQTTLFSDETGYYKPHPIVFKIALENLRCSPERALHIGDLLETDIKGAKDCNMYAIWIKNHRQTSYSDVNPDFEIDKIFEVIDIVRGIL